MKKWTMVIEYMYMYMKDLHMLQGMLAFDMTSVMTK